MGAKRYSQEFKDEAVKLVLESGTAVRQAARELGISEFTLRDWIKKAQPTNNKSRELTKDEEIRRLQAENKRLRMEREILKKATAFFARHQS
jgi:transposase